MSGKGILVVGRRGSGKTTTNRRLLSKAHPDARLVLDVNGEYKDLFPHEPISFDKFTNLAVAVKNAVILIEEATIFLSNRGNNFDVRQLLVQARHNNNTIIFSFHSFRTIPKYIFDLCNVVIIHKTGDSEEVLEQFDNEDLIKAFTEIKNAPMLKNSTGVEYSPQKVFVIY